LPGGGYEIAWKNGSGSQYTVWDVDSNGNYLSSPIGSVAGTDPRLEQLETTFGQDLNGDGTVGLTNAPTLIQIDGSINLVKVASTYFALDNSALKVNGIVPDGGYGAGPLLEYQNAPVTVGEFGASWAPIAAAALSGGGYEVAWQNGSTGAFTVWDTDANGNYLGSPTGGGVAASDPKLEQIETTFGQDLNGDGTVGLTNAPTLIQTDGSINLVEIAGAYFALDAGGAGPLLEYQNAAVTVGEFGAWSPIGAAALSGGGDEVAWRNGSTGQYTVWNTDANGNYLNSPIGVVAGSSFALEDLEPSFGQDLNGDGWLSSALVAAAGSNGVVNLSGQTQPTTVDLGANGAVATGGLNAASLAFAGAPDDVTFGSGKSILEYAVAPSSGIEEVENFAYGTDLLNLDLLGGGSNSLLAFDTSVGGHHAIALASSSDLQHGVVLLNLPTADTAANLLTSHVTFAGGHALVS
jgi:serralysin